MMECLIRELFLQNIPANQQVIVPVEYKGFVIEEPLQLDVFVDECLILELKAVEKIEPIHVAQMITYLRLSGKRVGLLINFNVAVLREGIRRFVL